MSCEYEASYKLRYREVDRNGVIKTLSWFDFMQEAAADHATRIGFGYEVLSKENCCWVLAGVHLEVDRAVRVGETVRLITWPGAFRRLFAKRHFVFIDESEREVARASSQWMVLSLASGRPQRVENIAVGLPDNSDRPAYFEFDSKIPVVSDKEDSLVVPVYYSMEDVNGHLNNAGYVGIAQDWIDHSLGKPNSVKSFEISFVSAAKAPDALLVNGEKISDAEYLVTGRKKSDGSVSFVSRAILMNS
jgi:acyl-CoA thioesterase FadM